VPPVSSERLSRRAVLAGLAGGAAAITLAQSPIARAASWFPRDRAWPLPAHDLAGTRAAPVQLGAVAERWRAHLAGGITGAPIIQRNRVLAASFGGDVGAFDLATGRQRWLRPLGTATYGTDGRQLGFFGGLAVAGDRAIVASDRAVCLSVSTGATIWEADPIRAPGADDYFWAPPAIVGRTVLLGSGAGSEATATRGRLTAYSLLTGALLWSTPTVPETGNGGGILSQPTVDVLRRRVYAATGAPYAPQPGDNPGSDSLLELRLNDGVIVWADQVHAGDQLGLDLNSAPVIIGPLLVVAGKDGFRAWNRLSRQRLWHVQTTPSSPAPGAPADPTTGPEGGSIASDGTRVYGLSNDSAAGTCVAAALDPSSGRVLWQSTLPAFSFAPPAIARDAVAVPGSDGTLRLLAPASGALLAELPLGEPSSGGPSVTDETVLVGTGAGAFLPGDSLVCFTR
jgi:outer membrane protein assembly factor BamB